MWSVRRVSVWLFFSAILESLCGCSHPFMPLGDDQVVIAVRFTTAAKYLPADVIARICGTDPEACGQRIIDEDRYEPDTFHEETSTDSTSLYFHPKGPATPTIQPGSYSQSLLDYETVGDTAKIFFNDFPPSEVSFVQSFDVTYPPFEEPIHLSTSPALRVEWSPSIPGSTMFWRTVSLWASKENDPCNALEWTKHEDQTEDTGVLELPWEFFPSKLPAEGCDAMVIVERRAPGKLGEGLQGEIHASSHSAAFFRLFP